MFPPWVEAKGMERLTAGQRSRHLCSSILPPDRQVFLTCVRLRIWVPVPVPPARVDVGSAYRSFCQSQREGGDYVEAAGCRSYRDPPLPSNTLLLCLSSKSPSANTERRRGGWRKEKKRTEGRHNGEVNGGRQGKIEEGGGRIKKEMKR